MSKRYKCIMLVDDDKATNFVNQIWIKKAEITDKIVTVDNGKMALDYIHHIGEYESKEENPSPDIILLDINMPIMDGWEFLDNVKSNTIKDCQIFMLTSSPNPDDEERARQIAEVKGFFRKPITKEMLARLVND